MVYEVREDASVWVDGVRCYVVIEDNILRAMIRANNKATFDAAALQVGLRVINDEGQTYIPHSVTLTELGPYTITQETLDTEGNTITPAVLDSRYHVNFWIDLAQADDQLWQQWAPLWTLNGQAAPANKDEVAYEYNGIELLDPLTISSPSNILYRES